MVNQTQSITPYASMYIYPWDLVDEGIEAVLNRVNSLGLSAVNVATVYHAGKFILPHNPRRRVHFTEDGAAYFSPQGKYYQNTTVKPIVSSLCAERDVLNEVAEACQRLKLKLIGWTICLHNTALGLEHKELVAHNAFGDPYYYSLCPAQHQVREYAKALVTNLVSEYPFYAVELESLAWLGFRHGFHHEFYLVSLGLLEEALLSLCFCEACERAALEANLDFAQIKETVKGALTRALAESADKSGPALESAYRLMDFVLSHRSFYDYLQLRCRIVTELLADLKQIASAHHTKLFSFGPVFIRPASLGWVEGFDLAALSAILDLPEFTLYFEDLNHAQAELEYLSEKLNGRDFGVAITAGHLLAKSESDLVRLVELANKFPVSVLSFYNYGHLPEYRLQWIRAALARWRYAS